MKKLFVLFALVFSLSAFSSEARALSGSGSSADPYLIYDVNDLQSIPDGSPSYYELANDIDASPAKLWNGGQGFSPIQNFKGALDGKSHKISNLYIHRPGVGNQALFANVVVYQGFKYIKNLGIENADVAGGYYSATLVGSGSSTCADASCAVIQNVYATGKVFGSFYTGGLIGAMASGNLIDAYANVDVSASNGSSSVGGLIGQVSSWFNPGNVIKNVYSTGKVQLGVGVKGGLVGVNNSSGQIQNAYWDVESSQNASSAAGIGKTTSQMKTQSAYANWDFSNIWAVSPLANGGYPLLRSLSSGAVSFRNVPVSFAGGPLSVTAPPISSSFGSFSISPFSRTFYASLGDMALTDATGLGAGYRVTVQASPFQEVGGAGYSFSAGSLSLSPPSSIVSLSGAPAPSPAFSSPTAIDAGSSAVFVRANAGEGMGVSALSFPPNALSLSLFPSDMRVDPAAYPSSPTLYSSTITWTIVSGP